jgi:hypothetical protein
MDRSGHGHHAMQVEANRRPVYLASAVDGRPAIRFNGNAGILEVGDLGATDGGSSVFAVLARPVATGSHAQRVFSAHDPAVGDDDTWPSTCLFAGGPGGPAPVAHGPVVLSVVNAGGTLRRAAVGAHGTQDRAYLMADLAEVLVYGAALSAEERSRVESYLAARHQAPVGFQASSSGSGVSSSAASSSSTAMSVPFPSDVNGLRVRLRAADMAPQGGAAGWEDGAAVPTWPNLVERSLDATQGVETARPRWRADCTPGAPCIEFDGVDDFLRLPDIRTSAGEVAVYLVSSNPGGAGGGYPRLLSSWNGQTMDDVTAPSFMVQAPWDPSGVPLPYPYDVRSHGGTGRVLQNLHLGSGQAGDFPFGGQVRELLVFDQALAPRAQQQVAAHLLVSHDVGGGALRPDLAGGLRWWLKADDMNCTGDGSLGWVHGVRVAHLNDCSGNAVPTWQADGPRRPVWVQDVQAPRGALRYDGPNDSTDTLNVRAGLGPVTVFVVAHQPVAPGEAYPRLLSAHDGAAANDYTAPAFCITAPHVVSSGEALPADVRVYTFMTAEDRTLARVRLGANATRDDNDFRGDILEVAVFDRRLEDAAFHRVMAYLVARWM